MSDLKKLDVFVKRMSKLGISIELVGNYPWIYLDKVNGNRIKEKFHADHGWTIGWLPVMANRPFTFTDIPEIFKIIRKYI